MWGLCFRFFTPPNASAVAVQGDKDKAAHYLRNYTQLAAEVLQMCAWSLGESPPGAQAAAGGADENNSNCANQDSSGRALLNPKLATLALQKGIAGALLQELEFFLNGQLKCSFVFCCWL